MAVFRTSVIDMLIESTMAFNRVQWTSLVLVWSSRLDRLLSYAGLVFSSTESMQKYQQTLSRSVTVFNLSLPLQMPSAFGYGALESTHECLDQ